MADYQATCPQCGSTVGADVSFCPNCGAGLNNDLMILEEVAPAGGGRARVPRPRLRTGVVVALAVAAAATAFALSRRHGTSPPPRRPAAVSRPSVTLAPTNTAAAGTAAVPTTPTTAQRFIDASTGTVLFLAGNNILERIDLDASTARSYDLPAASGLTPAAVNPGTVLSGPLAYIGDRIVLQTTSSTLAFPAGLDGPPVTLGNSVAFVRSWRPGRVWLISVPATGPVVREVDTAGHATAPPSALPADWQPSAAVDNGLLLTSSLGFEVWDPLADRVVYRSPPQAVVVAAAGAQVAWQLSGCQNLCALHLSTARTGADTLLYPQPADLAGSFQSGEFSPDGRYLVASGFAGNGARLVIVDLHTATAESVPFTGAGGPASVVWSPSGRWVFALDAGGSAQVYAHQRSTSDLTTIHLPPVAGASVSIAAA